MSKQMILLHNTPSPFCRKVDVVLTHHKLEGQIEVQIASTHDVTDRLETENPLGKIPTLILAEGGTLYDSDVIVEYFDSIGHGDKLLPTGADKFLQLTQYKLTAGITDAALLVVYEKRLRPEDKYCREIVDFQMAKINKGLTWFVDHLPRLEKLDMVNIGLGVLLEYLDIRINEDLENGTDLGENIGLWRSSHAALSGWLAEFNVLCPYFGETRP